MKLPVFNCHLEVGNGNEYPEIHYTPSTDMTHVYRDVLKLMSIKIMNTVKGHYSTEVISVPYFLSYFFDLTKQKMDIISYKGTMKLTFKYEPSGQTVTAY